MRADQIKPCDLHRVRPRWLALLVVTSALVVAPFAGSATSAAASSDAAAPDEALRAGAVVFAGQMDDSQGNADLATALTSAQSDLAAVATPPSDADPVSSNESSSSSKYIYLAVIVVALGLFGFLLGPRVIASRDRREISWLDAFAKSAVIVVGLIVSIVIVPAKALELSTVQNKSRAVQDIIAVGLWSGALAIALVALWWAHRERRI